MLFGFLGVVSVRFSSERANSMEETRGEARRSRKCFAGGLLIFILVISIQIYIYKTDHVDLYIFFTLLNPLDS